MPSPTLKPRLRHIYTHSGSNILTVSWHEGPPGSVAMGMTMGLPPAHGDWLSSNERKQAGLMG